MKKLKQTKKIFDTSTLTERERTLLFLLAVVLIAVGGLKYIVAPLQTRTAELKGTRDNLQMQEVDTRASIDTLEATKAENKRLIQEIKKKSEDISEFLNDESVDSLITGICIKNGLKPIALSIESEPYKKLEIDENREATTTQAEQTDENSEIVAVPEEALPSYTRTATVSMVITGSKDSMLNFIDEINKKAYLLVDEFSSSFSSSDKTEGVNVITHTVKIKINMINADIK